ncbi:toll/interleukin-1 receptor domain-containing protein [Streptomyces prunicolor]|jgi:hypothetical protein|uniref:toll/interleukin-1 receptor domain-containing protein n=1 Tax=Streptomyces prunicolor TaxID=67348 RepID=UPI0003820600|nr:toll/interleukin-1 receptor domain-containing protein [Streptomyces prunicolor]
MSAASSLSCRVVLSYARLDEAHRQTFRKHVADLERSGVHVFDDRDIPTGVDWEPVLFDEMERADIIVLLLTPNFVASEFCMDSELPIAERRWKAGECRLFPVNVAPFDVAKDSFLGRLQRTPSDKSLTEYRTAAPKQWREVARQLRKLVEGVSDARDRGAAPTSRPTDSGTGAPGGQGAATGNHITGSTVHGPVWQVGEVNGGMTINYTQPPAADGPDDPPKSP